MRITFNRRLFVAVLVVMVAGLMFRASYFQEHAEAFLFPMIVAGAILALTLVSLVREVFDLCVEDFQAFPFARQLPAILIMIAAVTFVEILGMYASAFLALAMVSIWYSPEENNQRRLVRSLLFSVGFTGFMYVLFSLMLNVQLPRGILI